MKKIMVIFLLIGVVLVSGCTKEETSTNEKMTTTTKETTTTLSEIYDLSDFPKTFIENQKTKTLVIIGNESSSNDVIIAVGIAAEIIKISPLEYPNPIAFLDTEINEKSNQPLILIGGPNNNRITASALGVNYPTSIDILNLPEKAAIIKTINNAFGGDYPVIIVAGNDGNFTCLAADVLVNYDKFSLKGNEIIIDESFIGKIDESICETKIEILE
jgi:hypothetical protein